MTGAGVGRLLVIMGSGETAPTMVKVHRATLERLGPPPVPAVMLDTPYGFQENASEIAARAVHYFDESLRAPIDVVGLPAEDDALATERFLASVRAARYVFAGPGSPSYALRKWSGTVVPDLLAEKLERGGAVVFASAAALTLGVSTIPVYEIYKCGEDPRWLDGLDLTALAGLNVAVIPHYDNAEGGTHDTRFCYLGERRLAALEHELPAGAFVLGVDEHTAVVLDLERGLAEVIGRGVLTIRASGRSHTVAAGASITVEEINARAAHLASGTDAPLARSEQATDAGGHLGAAPAGRNTSPLVDLVHDRQAAFAEALAARDVDTAVRSVLELEQEVHDWSADIPGGDELDRAHAALRGLIVELAELSATGARDPREVLGPFVETLLELRATARAERRFEESDLIRARLTALGVEVRDGPDGSDWVLTEPA